MDIMKYSKTLLGGAAVGSLALMAACVVEPPAQPAQSQFALTAAPTTAACASCGVITAIQEEAPADYRVTLHMDSGEMRTLDQSQQPAFRVGDRVQILTRTSTSYPSQ